VHVPGRTQARRDAVRVNAARQRTVNRREPSLVSPAPAVEVSISMSPDYSAAAMFRADNANVANHEPGSCRSCHSRGSQTV